jgi:uncharacterized membrane protein
MGFFERIGEFFASLPGELYVFLISVLPLIELRGAVPVGAALGLPWYINAPLAVIGNILPIPFILLFVTKVFDWMAKFKLFRPMIEWLRKKANKHSSKVLGDETDEPIGEKRGMSVGVFVGLLLFVALPVPGTGAWSGALVAALFDLPKKKSFLAIFLGVLICAVIMTLASYGVLGFLKFLL